THNEVFKEKKLAETIDARLFDVAKVSRETISNLELHLVLSQVSANPTSKLFKVVRLEGFWVNGKVRVERAVNSVPVHRVVQLVLKPGVKLLQREADTLLRFSFKMRPDQAHFQDVDCRLHSFRVGGHKRQVIC